MYKNFLFSLLLLVAVSIIPAQQAEARIDCIANGSLGEGCYDCTYIIMFTIIFGCFEVPYSAYCGCTTSNPNTCRTDSSNGFCDYEGGVFCDGPVCPEG